MENFEESIDRISENCIKILESTIEKIKEIKNLKCKGCQLINLITIESAVSFFIDTIYQIQGGLVMIAPFIHKIIEEKFNFDELRKDLNIKNLEKEEIEKLEKMFKMKPGDK